MVCVYLSLQELPIVYENLKPSGSEKIGLNWIESDLAGNGNGIGLTVNVQDSNSCTVLYIYTGRLLSE